MKRISVNISETSLTFLHKFLLENFSTPTGLQKSREIGPHYEMILTWESSTNCQEQTHSGYLIDEC